MQALRLLPRALCTSLRRYAHPRTVVLSPQAHSTNTPPILPAIAAAVATLTAHIALSDEKNHDWHSLISQLQSQTHPPQFSASLRPHDHADNTSSYTLHFPAHADLLPVLAHLSAELLPDGKLTVHDSPTKTLLTVVDTDFQLNVSLPRIPPFDASVELQIVASSTPRFTQRQVDAILVAYTMCQPVESPALLDGRNAVEHGPMTTIESGAEKSARKRDAKRKLEQLGVDVVDPNDSLNWDALAGYKDVKEQIEDTLTLPLKHPKVYESIVRGTRKRYQSNLPKAVLYEGPPGCGKTLSARILAARIGVPFVHVPLETVLSKFYGETTRKLADILDTANQLGTCLVFIDECDTIGLSRSSSDLHEVTRRTLSVLLRHIDGIDGPQNTILLAATNHKQDIDPALMSRFDVIVSFPLPDVETRAEILKLYAKHLSKEELTTLAALCNGFSGRELFDVCQQAERMKGGDIVRGADKEPGKLPALKHYIAAIKRKQPHVVGRNGAQRRHSCEPHSNFRQRSNGPAPSVAI